MVILLRTSQMFGNIDTAKIDFTKKMAIVNAFTAPFHPISEKRIRAYYGIYGNRWTTMKMKSLMIYQTL